jgi:hypothetical protein
LSGKRPDNLVTYSVKPVLLVCSEEKVKQFVDAHEDILKKIGDMSDEFYADLPFVFTYAACKET